jgi:hypothetical protein
MRWRNLLRFDCSAVHENQNVKTIPAESCDVWVWRILAPKTDLIKPVGFGRGDEPNLIEAPALICRNDPLEDSTGDCLRSARRKRGKRPVYQETSLASWRSAPATLQL